MKIDWIRGVSVAVLLSSCAGTMPVVGIDGAGKLVDEKFEHDKYVREMVVSLAQVQTSVAPALDRQETRPQWDLSTVLVGLALQPQGGIGPYVIGGNAGIRLYIDRIRPNR